MGAVPDPKRFNLPTPFGSSPNPNVLQQVQPAVQIPQTGFANTNQGDSGITPQAPSGATPQGQGAGAPNFKINPFAALRGGRAPLMGLLGQQ